MSTSILSQHWVKKAPSAVNGCLGILVVEQDVCVNPNLRPSAKQIEIDIYLGVLQAMMSAMNQQKVRISYQDASIGEIMVLT